MPSSISPLSMPNWRASVGRRWSARLSIRWRWRGGPLIGGGVAAQHFAEVDRVDQQRWEPAIARRLGDDVAREREQEARRLDQHHRTEQVFGDAAHRDQPAIAQLDHKKRLIL